MEQTNSVVREGLVIGLIPYGEHDLILRVIVREEGKLSLYARRAKNSKKRFGSPFDLFDRGSFGYRHTRGSLLELEHFSPLRSFKYLREDLTKLSVASILCEAFDALTLEQHPNAMVYTCLEHALNSVETASDARSALRACFAALTELLEDSGYSVPGEFGEPSAHNIMRVINRLEETTERRMKTKPTLTALIETLRSAS